ncbi:MAG: hypothetical protein KJ989_13105 [Gammaproteobacteria bacterium]|uniref:Uncharacterized protein n=1 Tax=viral metagenome TaxID=1070528 RepID=A0A6M3KKK6_9ZZZZ|nr:hypothetical protein [Gammaproteobacteria bacterium]MBU2157153.1 hypothetical protein [Gammaproteobacteria bacterium]MBU2256067.1 hypothetical protein [Gammaproteobacteria bacterium]MBU2295135.1 hypothetical protein [Gammaproteobacteria bacterium]
MGEHIRWKPKLDSRLDPIPDCWLTNAGYTVAKVRAPAERFTITRPGDAAPFAYTDAGDDVPKLISADIEASKPPGVN